MAVVAWLLAAASASAQWLPAQPVTWLGGRLVVSGDASIAYATSHHDTYFNFGDYQSDTMRLVRIGLGTTLRLAPRVAVVADVRAEGEVSGEYWHAYPVSLFLQARPVRASSLAVSAGIVQPVFGAFTQRRYGSDNLLIGYPLSYQYTTAVRADALPATADEVLKNRARGWAPHYSIGSTGPVSGLPLVNTTGWSPGLMVSAGSASWTGRVAVTRGGLAAAGSSDWNGRWEITGRGEYRPTAGLVLGVSGAHGAFVDESLSPVVQTATGNRAPRETAFGADVEYSWGYWLVRAETIVHSRRYPDFSAPHLADALTTIAFEAEARYKLRPGLYAAARMGGLWFGSLQGSTKTASWDADVTRLETGLGWSYSRNVMVKAVYQYNRRDSVRKPSLHLGALQLVVKF